jgi:hypothetical protein
MQKLKVSINKACTNIDWKSLLSKEKKIFGVDDVLKEDGGGFSVRVIYDNFYISHDYEDAV